jgi:hypothetical protein
MKVNNIKNILAIINPKAYPKQIQDIKKVMSVDDDDSKYFGSFTYKSQPYPSDVDIIEEVEYYDKNQSQKYAVTNFVKDIQKIIKKVMKTDNIIFSEFKAGKDFRYDPFGYKLLDEYGKLKYESENIIGKVYNGKVINYKYEELKQFINNLYSEKLLNKEEYNFIQKNIKKKINIEEFENIYFTLRKHLIVRWTPDEIIKGYKILPGNYKFTLFDACSQTEPNVGILIKLDVLSFINNKFIELTNTYNVFTCYSKNKKCAPINMNNPTPEQIKKSLISDIYYLASSHNDFSPFKLSKRMWALSRMTNNISVINKLQPLLSSDVGGIRQVSSELETIIMVLEKSKLYSKNNLPIIQNQIIEQLDNIKVRLSKNTFLEIDDNKIIRLVNEAIKTKNTEKRIKILEELEDYIKEEVNSFTEIYLKENKLLPLPKQFIPSDKILRYY